MRSSVRDKVILSIAGVVIVLTVFSSLFLFTHFLSEGSFLGSNRLYVQFMVGGYAGFDVNGTALTFGMIPPGGSSTRSLFVTNGFDVPARVIPRVTHSIAPYLVFPVNLTLQSGERAKVPVTLTVPSSLAYGNYSGWVRFDFYAYEP